jgi:two-component system sensor kinase
MTKILVIEDQSEVRQNLEDILSLENYDVVTASDGEQGLDLAKQILPNLILCDVMMPKLSGFEVLRSLRQDPQLATIPFILLTAKADHAAIRQGMTLGADDYLTKPFSLDDLLQAVNTRLTQQQQRQNETRTQLDELRQHLTRSLPHELLTPLNGILGTTELLANFYDSFSKAEILESVFDIKSSGERLHRLVQNFLLMADLDLLAASPDRLAVWQSRLTESIDLAATLSNLLAGLGPKHPRINDVILLVTPLQVNIAEPDFCKIVGELLDNAFKFSLPGTPIHLTARSQDQCLHFTLQDQGRGMNPQEQQRIGAHTQFQRSHYEQQGSGLGLSLAKRLTELYGGELAIASEPNKGTAITITGWKCVARSNLASQN